MWQSSVISDVILLSQVMGDRGHLVSLWIPHNMEPMWQEERAARDTFRMPASSYQNTLPYVTYIDIEILTMLV